ncbi:MAG: alpha/beta fold hydrolase [Ktedonobacterales bacterium]|nr:alpha/beta fold hydrolase [Ktedonobacterales bacterium]
MSESRESDPQERPTPDRPTAQPPVPGDVPTPAEAPSQATPHPPRRASATPRRVGQGDGRRTAPLPTNARRGSVRSIHYDLSYVLQDAERGPRGAIVLLHDLPGGAFTWDPVLPALARAGRAVYAFDMLAYGQSSRPWPSDTSIWGHADALLYAFERLRLSEIVLVGLGLGGGVAQVLATRLYRAGVAKLALLNTYAYEYAFAPDWPLPDMAKHQDPELAHHTPVEQVLGELRATLPNGSATPDALDAQRLAAYADEWNSETGKHLLFQHVRLLIRAYQNAPASDLRELRLPVLVAWGERDGVTPIALGERLAAEMPNARLERIAGAGHLVMDDAPAAVGQLVADFAG